MPSPVLSSLVSRLSSLVSRLSSLVSRLSSLVSRLSSLVSRPERLVLFLLAVNLFLVLFCVAPAAHAQVSLSGVTLQNLAAGFSWNTQGPDAASNLYISQNNGATFLNSGNAASTSINLALVSGTNTYQFYGSGTGPENLALALFFNGVNSTPRITANSNVNQPGNSFAPTGVNVFDVSLNVVPGSNAVVYATGGTTVTLTSYSYNSGGDLVGPNSTAPDGVVDTRGSFTLNVVTTAPEASSFALLPLGGLVGGMVVMRRRGGLC